MKMHHRWFIGGILLSASMLSLTGWMGSKSADKATNSAVDDVHIGIISPEYCFNNSKFGKTEKTRYDDLENQVRISLQQKEKELNEMAAKFNEEYLDTLTPEAEAELRQKFQTQGQQYSQDQNNYFQSLDQLRAQVMQKMLDMISEASKRVAKEKGLKLTLSEQSCFYYQDSFDISDAVVKEMDVMYEHEMKAQSQSEGNKQEQKK